MSAQARSPSADWPRPALANWALAVLVVAYAFSFIDRTILSMLVAPVKRDLKLSDTQIALLNGFAFSIFYATMGLPLGRLVDKVSRRGVIAAGVAVWSVVTACSGLSANFAQIFLARVGVGVGEAALSPGAFSMLADYFPPQQRGRAIGVYSMGVSIGSGLAYLVGGLLIAFVSKHPALPVPGLGTLVPWRFVFVAVGLPGLLVALLMLSVKEPARRVTGHGAALDTRKLLAFLRQERATLASYLFAYALTNVPFALFLAWGPAFLMRRHGMHPAQMGLALGLIFLGPACLGQIVGAWWSDTRFKAGQANAMFQTGLVCAALLVPFAALTTLAMSTAGCIASLAVSVFLVCASVGHAPAVATLICPNQLRGQVSALYILVLNLVGQGLATLVVALISDNILHDPSRIGVAMAVVGPIGAALGALSFALGLKPLKATVEGQARARAADPAPPFPPVEAVAAVR